MATSTRATLTRLETTEDKVSVNACWAPSTSLFSRLISAPVWVRVKKASGIRPIWANTWERMSKMRPSPTLAETHRSPMDSPAPTRARPAASTARPMISSVSWLRDAGVDDGSEDERIGHADHGVDDDQHQEDDQDGPVGLGEVEHSPGRALGHLDLGDRVVASQRMHRRAELATADGGLTAVAPRSAAGHGKTSAPRSVSGLSDEPSRLAPRQAPRQDGLLLRPGTGTGDGVASGRRWA